MVLETNVLIKASHNNNAKGVVDVEQLDIEIKNIISVKVELDVNTLTNTASIELPKKELLLPRNTDKFLKYRTDDNNNKLYFNDKIDIYLGYNSRIEQVFTGYFTNFEIKQDSIVLNLQDNMYYFKIQPKIQLSYDSVSLKQLLKDMKFDTAISNTWDENNIIDFTLPKLRTDGYMLKTEVLKMLKDNYNFYVYYLKGKLYAGHKYPLNTVTEQTNANRVYVFDYPYFDFVNTSVGKSIYKSSNQVKSYPIIKNNLNKLYVNDDLISIVNVTQADNSKQTYWLTYDQPDVQTTDIPPLYNDYHKIVINDVNLSDADGIQLCESNLYNYPTDNYTGNFTTFGFPTLYPNDTVLLALNMVDVRGVEITNKNLDLNYFLVEKVIKTFNNKGYTQTVYLDENYLSKNKINRA